MKMKKILIMLVALLMLPIYASAYTSEEYSIELSEGYNESKVKNMFENSNGDNINLQISNGNEYKNATYEDFYGNKTLSEVVNSFKTSMVLYKDEIKKQLLSQYMEAYGEELSQQEIETTIDDIVNDMKIEVLDSKIGKFTKNNYPCLHYRSIFSMSEQKSYTDTYQVLSNSKLYTVTVSAANLSTLDSDGIKSMLNSFTINNYKEPEHYKDTSSVNNKPENTNKIFDIKSIIFDALIGALVAGTASLIGIGISKKVKKSKKNTDIPSEINNSNIEENK